MFKLKLLSGAAIVLGLAGASLATAGTAHAAILGISLDFGNVAFGYQDGYWDRAHRWHHWRHDEMRRYRLVSGNHYNDWRHDRDRDHGWHDRS
jgi:hypothetical protein